MKRVLAIIVGAVMGIVLIWLAGWRILIFQIGWWDRFMVKTKCPRTLFCCLPGWG